VEKGFKKRDYLREFLVLGGDLEFAGFFVRDDGDVVL
jgi:hypothetical protein